jgi:hypothetical protein
MLRKGLRLLLGDAPRQLWWCLVPTGLAVIVDLALRARTLASFAVQGKAIYGSSLLISAALWALPVWLVARGVTARRDASGHGSAVWTVLLLVLVLLAWIFPVATFGYGGQVLYHRVFHSYMGRDTLRLGIALRGTVIDWFVAWGGASLVLAVVAAGAVVSFGFFLVARRVAAPGARAVPWLLVATFVAAIGCLWFDQLDSRFLQAAAPDACFVHGVVHAARVRLAGKPWLRQGVSQRDPLPLPTLLPSRPSGEAPNVLIILTESVRADATCSEPAPACRAPFFDDVVPDRVALGTLRTLTPNTFSAFLVLTTGLDPNVDFVSAHRAPMLWELARAVGYRTAYVSAQNPKYEDFGTFVERAGIDVLVTGTDLGGIAQEQIGAPDESATRAMLDFVEGGDGSRPYFAVLHLSNTHAPYRVDPGLQPFAPSAESAFGGSAEFHNRYRNSVLLLERTVSSFLKGLMRAPGWDRTVVVFLSDHGEQFAEHGSFFHNHSLYDEDLRIPGWIVAGERGLTNGQRAALASCAGHPTYSQDVHETVVDLLGLEEMRGSLPLAEKVHGRSLVRAREREEPVALLATSTAVWEPDDARYGAMRGGKAVFTAGSAHWACFDLEVDPSERTPLPESACGDLASIARAAFPLRE